MLNKLKFLVVFLSIFIFAGSAFAHSKLNKTKPENGAVLQAVPDSFYLYFGKKIRLTKVLLYFQENTPVKLDLDKHRKFGNEFEFANPATGVGKYRIEYRGIGEDGHAMRNEFTFEVKK